MLSTVTRSVRLLRSSVSRQTRLCSDQAKAVTPAAKTEAGLVEQQDHSTSPNTPRTPSTRRSWSKLNIIPASPRSLTRCRRASWRGWVKEDVIEGAIVNPCLLTGQVTSQNIHWKHHDSVHNPRSLHHNLLRQEKFSSEQFAGGESEATPDVYPGQHRGRDHGEAGAGHRSHWQGGVTEQYNVVTVTRRSKLINEIQILFIRLFISLAQWTFYFHQWCYFRADTNWTPVKVSGKHFSCQFLRCLY